MHSNAAISDPRPLELRSVIQALGSDAFGTCLASTLQRELGIAQLMVFHGTAAAPWDTLIAHNFTDERVARRLAHAYTAQFWTRDPNRHRLDALPMHQAEIYPLRDPRVIDRDYRRTLFLEPQLVDKMSVLFRTPERTFYINLYRDERAGAFQVADIDRLRLACGILAALIEKHVSLQGWNGACTLDQLLRLFGQESGQGGACLSEREVQTCARIVLGYSTEAIALDFGVSLHSAVTYRKRAFAKFGIATQHELFGIVLKRRHLLDR